MGKIFKIVAKQLLFVLETIMATIYAIKTHKQGTYEFIFKTNKNTNHARWKINMESHRQKYKLLQYQKQKKQNKTNSTRQDRDRALKLNYRNEKKKTYKN